MNRPLRRYEEEPPRSPPNKVGRRGAARLRLSIPGRLITLSDTKGCIVVDMSCSGLQIGLAEPLSNGTDVIVQTAGYELFGTVVRCLKNINGGSNGIVFEIPLDKSDILAVRAYSETYEYDEQYALRKEAMAWVSGK